MIPRQLDRANPERFDYLSGVGSGGCTDLDMVIERHDNYLIIENKQPGEELSRGQQYTLEKLQKRPGVTLWVVYGIPPSQIISVGPLNGEQRPCDVHELRAMAQEWWDGLAK